MSELDYLGIACDNLRLIHENMELRALRCDCDEESGNHDPNCILMVREQNANMLEDIARLRGELAEARRESAALRVLEENRHTIHMDHGFWLNIAPFIVRKTLVEFAESIQRQKVKEAD